MPDEEPPPDVARPSRMRLLAVLLLAVVVAACSDNGLDVPEPEGSWSRGADMPLSPRSSPQVGWTGSEVLVVGGDTSVVPDDTGGGPGDPVADGAAYDPSTDTWRPIADAPEPIPYYFRSGMVGDTMVVLTMTDDGREGHWLAYDAVDDAWTRLPDPPRRPRDPGSLAIRDGSVLVTTRPGDVMELDVASRTWSVLPRDTVEPRLDFYSVTSDGDDLFVCGPDPEVEEDGDTPVFVVVDRWDGSTWTRLPRSRQVDCPTHWTGERLVNTDIQTATGLDGNPPFGGRLDPATGEWSPLPDAPDPEERGPDHITVNAADGPLVVGWGYLYDDSDGSWTGFGRPDSPVDRATGAALVDGRLLVFGGRDEDAGYDGDAGLSAEAWTWNPGD
jgi:hypothetical protein